MFNKQEKQKLLVNNVIKGDVLNILKTFPTNCIDTIITSPPYWALRKYGDDNNELGQEQTFQEYVEKLVEIFDEVWRVLKKEGTCWVNISDTYISQGASRHIGYADPKNSKVGIKNYIEPSALPQSIQQKCLANIPHRFAIAMTDRGWIHRNTIIWYKRNAMPSSVKDRFTVDYEPVFFFTKQKKYYFEQQFEPYLSPMNRWGGEQVKKYTGKFSIGADVEKYNSPRARQMRLNYPERERSLRPNTNGKNMRCVWDLPTKPSNVAHFATFPETLVEPMLKAGCPEFVCNKCGKARERIIKKIKHEQIEIYNGKATKDYDKAQAQNPSDTKRRILESMRTENKTIGYSDCGCNAGFSSGIVLDPFMGSGTTGVVAKKLGRNYIGIELYQKYIDIINERLKGLQLNLRI